MWYNVDGLNDRLMPLSLYGKVEIISFPSKFGLFAFPFPFSLFFSFFFFICLEEFGSCFSLKVESYRSERFVFLTCIDRNRQKLYIEISA